MTTDDLLSEVQLAKRLALQEECEKAVDEFVNLVQGVNDWKEIRDTNTNLSSRDYQLHQDQVDRCLELCSENVIEAAKMIPHHFAPAVMWMYTQNDALIVELDAWKSKQSLVLLALPTEESENTNLTELRNLKKSFEVLEEFAWSLHKQSDRYWRNINNLQSIVQETKVDLCSKCRDLKEECQKRQDQIEDYIVGLIQKSLIVSVQPPLRVRLCKNSSLEWAFNYCSFELQIRFLAGQTVGLVEPDLEMEALLITEQQANNINTKTINPLDKNLPIAGNIIYLTWVLEAPNARNKGFISATFHNVIIVGIEMLENGNNTNYQILFRAKVHSAGEEFMPIFPFWALSSPFTIVTEKIRDPAAFGDYAGISSLGLFGSNRSKPADQDTFPKDFDSNCDIPSCSEANQNGPRNEIILPSGEKGYDEKMSTPCQVDTDDETD